MWHADVLWHEWVTKTSLQPSLVCRPCNAQFNAQCSSNPAIQSNDHIAQKTGLRLYNSLTKSKQLFHPHRTDGLVTMYVVSDINGNKKRLKSVCNSTWFGTSNSVTFVCSVASQCMTIATLVGLYRKKASSNIFECLPLELSCQLQGYVSILVLIALHVGHARVYISFDLLYRHLQSLGFKVRFKRIDVIDLQKAYMPGITLLHTSGVGRIQTPSTYAMNNLPIEDRICSFIASRRVAS